MKNFLFVFMVCLIFSCQTREKGNMFSVEGKAPAGAAKMVLIQNTGMFRPVQTAEVDESGKFRLEFETENLSGFQVGDDKGQYSVSVYARPGDRIRLDYEGDKVEFGGDEKENNRFVVQMNEWCREQLKQYNVGMEDAEAYKKAAASRCAASAAYIREAGLADKEFENVLLTTDMKIACYSMLKYPELYRMIFGKDAQLEDSYYDFVKEVDLNSPYLKNLSDINSFLRDVFQAMETNGYLTVGLDDYLVKRGELIGDPSVRESYLLFALDLELYGFNQEFMQLAVTVEPSVVTEKGKQKLAELKAKYNESLVKNDAFKTGRAAFNFTGTDAAGKQYSLADLKGKIVVVDVWNTGCKPCIAEIPHMKKIEKKFEGQDIVFVSYSLDTERDKWIEFIKDRNMGGNQWIDTAGFKSDFVKAFQMRGIPRFMIFDREGAIVDAFAPRPSDPRLALKLEKLL